MATKRPTLPVSPPRRYRGRDITLRVIRRYARQIVERFRPEQIILFGSFAYGTPRQDSDVDLLVVMPCPNHVTQAVRIRTVCPAPFPMDLLVRTPEKLRQRSEDGNQFLREVTEKGQVLYQEESCANGPRGQAAQACPRGPRDTDSEGASPDRITRSALARPRGSNRSAGGSPRNRAVLDRE